MVNNKEKKTSIDRLPSDSVISSGFFDFEDILKQPEALELISQVEALVSVRPSGKNIRLILGKIPEISGRIGKVTERLTECQDELSLIWTDSSKITVSLQKLTQKKTDLTTETQKIRSGHYSESDLTDLPNGLTAASLKQAKILELYLTARNNKMKQLDSDLNLLSRKQAYNQQRSVKLQAKVDEYQAYLTDLNNAGEELIQVLRQAKNILENDLTEVPELHAAHKSAQPMASTFPVRDAAEVWQEIDSEQGKTPTTESLSSSEITATFSEKTFVESPQAQVEQIEQIIQTDQINQADLTSSVETVEDNDGADDDGEDSTKLMSLTRKENDELENLLASREYNLWREKLESLEAKYSDPSDSENLTDQAYDEGGGFSFTSASENLTEDRKNYFPADDTGSYSKKHKNFWELEDKLTEASRDDIQYYSHLTEREQKPSRYELDFEEWLRKENKYNAEPMVTRFDPIITDD